MGEATSSAMREQDTTYLCDKRDALEVQAVELKNEGYVSYPSLSQYLHALQNPDLTPQQLVNATKAFVSENKNNPLDKADGADKFAVMTSTANSVASHFNLPPDAAPAVAVPKPKPQTTSSPASTTLR